MTLPSTLRIEFNNFDVMASTNPDDFMFEIQHEVHHNQTLENATKISMEDFNQNRNNNNNEINNHNINNNENIQQINTLNNSYPPTSPLVFPVATASAAIYSSNDLAVEAVMPGIYFTKNFIAWNEENLRAHGFTHIIIIDKHIQELYYPSPIFKLSTLNKNNELYETTSPFDYFCNAPIPPVAALNFSKDFEAIDLNFGEKSYLTTVLPNCYRAVRFISKALQSGGTILVIDCNGGDQKCLTIVVAYLMYKYNISFSDAFARLKSYYNKADLDRFYVSQLYEYEPILQVQRAQSRGHSCSRELHAAILKRKKTIDDDIQIYDESDKFNEKEANYIIADTSNRNDFLQNFNPLSHFNTTIAQQTNNYDLQQQKEQQQQRINEFQHIAKQQMTKASTEFQQNNLIFDNKTNFQRIETVNNQSNTFDDYVME